MAPLLSKREVGGLSQASLIWIIVSSSVAGVLFLTILALVIHSNLKARRRLKQLEYQQNLPPHDLAKISSELSEISLSYHPRRSSASASPIGYIEESQREYMIRKSLANRSTSRLSQTANEEDGNNNNTEAQTMMGNVYLREGRDGQGYDSRRESLKSLKDDWKEWEARVQSERGVSLEYHPAINDGAV